MTFISWPTLKEACTSSHYDTLFIALRNFVNLTIWAEILQMLFTCFQNRAQEKKKKKPQHFFYSIKHNKTQIGVSLKYSTIRLLRSRDLEFSKGLTLMSETCLFLRKPSPVKLPGEIILRNEPLGTLRSHTLHREFFWVFFFFKFNSFGVSSSLEPNMSFQIICCSWLWKGRW